jgi:LAS superfamily LD-carboxypeptidase LdcB
VLSDFELTGKARTHVVQTFERGGGRLAAMPEVVEAFTRMQAAAVQDGFDIAPCSSFRDFRTQIRIWNRKFEGRKVLFDEGGNPIDPGGLSGPDLVRTILFWSALPGESRHHWGTEIDVFDRSRLPPGMTPALLPHEVAPGGAFHDLHAWLDQNIERFGFFRPYAFRKSEGSMMSEPWHLSFADRSMPLLERVTPAVLMSAINGEGMAGLEHVMAMLDEIVAAHHRSICLPTEQIAIAGSARKAPRD